MSDSVHAVDVNAAISLDPSQILTPLELCARLKVSERWVYEKSRRRCKNPLPVIHIGRYLRFDWSEITAWLKKQSSGSGVANV